MYKQKKDNNSSLLLLNFLQYSRHSKREVGKFDCLLTDKLPSLICLQAIVNVIGMNKMTPPIKDLLPRLTPILKNRCDTSYHACVHIGICCVTSNSPYPV